MIFVLIAWKKNDIIRRMKRYPMFFRIHPLDGIAFSSLCFALLCLAFHWTPPLFLFVPKPKTTVLLLYRQTDFLHLLNMNNHTNTKNQCVGFVALGRSLLVVSPSRFFRSLPIISDRPNNRFKNTVASSSMLHRTIVCETTTDLSLLLVRRASSSPRCC